MLLAIDAGNTNVVFAVYDGEKQRGTWRIASDPRRTADEYAVWAVATDDDGRSEEGGCQRRDLRQRRAGGLVPYRHGCARTISTARRWKSARRRSILGIEVLMDSPGEVGADRLVNAIAAAQAHKPPLIVIDFGTATTFDFVDADGNYCGGIIAPGINLSMDAAAPGGGQAAQGGGHEAGTGSSARAPPTACNRESFWGYVGLIEGLVVPRQAGIRRADDGGRHRRACRPVRRCDRCHRGDRRRTDHARPAPHIRSEQQ